MGMTFFVVVYLGAHTFNGSIQWFTYESADFRVSAVLYLGFHPVALNFALLDVPSTSIMSSYEGCDCDPEYFQLKCIIRRASQTGRVAVGFTPTIF